MVSASKCQKEIRNHILALKVCGLKPRERHGKFKTKQNINRLWSFTFSIS